MMDLENKIKNKIALPLENIGVKIVSVNFSNKILQILLEKDGYKSISLDECAKATKLISPILDYENLIDSKYFLEVSSAGIERPLFTIKDYEHFIGSKAKLTLKKTWKDKTKLIGFIKEVVKEKIIFALNNDDVIEIEFDNISSAKLLIDIKLEN